MAASILRQCGNVLYTAGNFNNDIGVPLTLFRLTPEHDYAVIELGANHIGEIAYTTAMVRPEAALVNNLAAAHLEGFGSLEGVAQAKGEIFWRFAFAGRGDRQCGQSRRSPLAECADRENTVAVFPTGTRWG
ncbi:hypothetical protein OS12_30090 [Dickeya oryzae]